MSLEENFGKEDIEDIIYLGALHYEKLLLNRNLIDDATGEIKGQIDFVTWFFCVHHYWEDNIAAVEDRRLVSWTLDLYETYILSKAHFIGTHLYETGHQEFSDWTHHLVSELDEREAAEIEPRLQYLYNQVLRRAQKTA